MQNLIQKRGFFTIIKQGTKGVRLFLGNNPTLLEPGINLKIPILHQLKRVDMRETAITIGITKKIEVKKLNLEFEIKNEKIQCFTSDNISVNVKCTLSYKIKDVIKSCFNVNNPEERLCEIGTSILRSVIKTFKYDEIISNKNKINLKLKEVIEEYIKKIGIDCTKFDIQTFELSNSDIEKQKIKETKEKIKAKIEEHINQQIRAINIVRITASTPTIVALNAYMADICEIQRELENN